MKRKRGRESRLVNATVEELSCTSKVRHPNEMMARMSAKAFLFRSRGKRQRMWLYPCQFCTGWHVTSRLSGHGCVEA